MPGKEDNRMSCSEFDALLSQAIDGTLAGDRLSEFENHARACKLCGPLLDEAEAGRSWLNSRTEVEPPDQLVSNILLRTSGMLSSCHFTGELVPRAWLGRILIWSGGLSSAGAVM